MKTRYPIKLTNKIPIQTKRSRKHVVLETDSDLTQTITGPLVTLLKTVPTVRIDKIRDVDGESGEKGICAHDLSSVGVEETREEGETPSPYLG